MSEGRLRTRPAGAVCALALVVLAARLLHLQVVERPAWAARAAANRDRTLTVPAARGRILDRHGEVLVTNRAAFTVALSRSVPEAEHRGLLERLAPLLGRGVDDLARRLTSRRPAPFAPLPLAEDVPEDVVVAIRERPEQFPGIEIDAVPRRHHPFGALAAHVLGTTGEAGGGSGVEAEHDATLAGRPGARTVEVDARGRIVRRLGERPARPGADVRLTLDARAQAAAEAALVERMAAARPVHAAPAGAVVALDCRTGEVLVLASAPAPAPASASASAAPAGSAQVNRVVQGLYAPGSTFKPVTALAGLAAGAISPGTVVDDRGSYRVGGRVFRNAQGRAYGRVDLARSLAVSSDVYFYGLGERLHRAGGDGPVQAAARQLGLGSLTGIDLPGEEAGRVPGPAWRAAAHHQGLFPDPGWYTGDSVNLAIGQGDLVVTPLQLAVAYAALGNGGFRPVPHVTAGAARVPAPAGLAPEALAAVLAGLYRAVATPEGTAAEAFSGFAVPGVTVVGKTGTAQRAGRSDTALFAAVARGGDRCVAAVAVVEEAGFGSVVAAPVVRRTLEALFA